MVERLKAAIEKARAARSGAPAWDASAMPVPSWRGSNGSAEKGARAVNASAGHWAALGEITPNPRTLRRERIVTRDKSESTHVAFDALRTRLLKALHDNRWFRVAITSPTQGCGKTTVAINLAFSLARQVETRCMLLDLDLRLPQIGARLGQREAHDIEPYLAGEMAPAEYLRRIGPNLAIGLNSRPVPNSAELLHGTHTAAALNATWELYRPHVALFDMPPMLTSDDVLTFLPNIDGVLLVAGGGQSKADEIGECERLMAGNTNFLGVILNRAEDRNQSSYHYDHA